MNEYDHMTSTEHRSQHWGLTSQSIQTINKISSPEVIFFILSKSKVTTEILTNRNKITQFIYLRFAPSYNFSWKVLDFQTDCIKISCIKIRKSTQVYCLLKLIIESLRKSSAKSMKWNTALNCLTETLGTSHLMKMIRIRLSQNLCIFQICGDHSWKFIMSIIWWRTLGPTS